MIGNQEDKRLWNKIEYTKKYTEMYNTTEKGKESK